MKKDTVMEIRPYLESDEAAVASLWREVFPDSPSWNHPETAIRRNLAVQVARTVRERIREARRAQESLAVLTTAMKANAGSTSGRGRGGAGWTAGSSREAS